MAAAALPSLTYGQAQESASPTESSTTTKRTAAERCSLQDHVVAPVMQTCMKPTHSGSRSREQLDHKLPVLWALLEQFDAGGGERPLFLLNTGGDCLLALFVNQVTAT